MKPKNFDKLCVGWLQTQRNFKYNYQTIVVQYTIQITILQIECIHINEYLTSMYHRLEINISNKIFFRFSNSSGMRDDIRSKGQRNKDSANSTARSTKRAGELFIIHMKIMISKGCYAKSILHLDIKYNCTTVIKYLRDKFTLNVK